MRAATGSQWNSMSSGVTCALFGWLNTRRATVFWIICSGFTTQAGRPARRAMQYSRRELTKVCTTSCVAYWVSDSPILRMLYSAKRHDLETEAMWAMKVSWSSIMTQRFLAVLDGTRDKELIIDIDVVVDDLFGWKDLQFRFSPIQLKVVIFHPCGYISKTFRDPRRDSGVIRKERQIQLSNIGIAVIGKTMRVDDRGRRCKWQREVVLSPSFVAPLWLGGEVQTADLAMTR